MVTKLIEFEKPKLRNPIFIEGLPGMGNVGRIAATYLVEELKAKKFAELISSHFMYVVLVEEDAKARVLKNEFYYWKAKSKKQNDLIILIGDSQSLTTEGHFEISETILNFLKKLKVKLILTLGGLRVGERVEKPKVFGAVNNLKLIKKFEKFKEIDFNSFKQIGTIVGAAGMLIGLGEYYGIDGICLLAETPGIPVIPDPKGAETILKVLNKTLNLQIDLNKIEKRAKEMEAFLRRIEDVRRKAVGFVEKPPSEKLTYIG